MPVESLVAEKRPPESVRETAPDWAPLIELRHVSKVYADAGVEAPVTVLDDISLEVREGEMLALLGQSGSGKSTILRIMAGLTEATQGAVLVTVRRSLASIAASQSCFKALPCIRGSQCRKTCELGSSNAASMRDWNKKKSRGHSNSLA